MPPPGHCDQCLLPLKRNGRFYYNDGTRKLCGPCYERWLRKEEVKHERDSYTSKPAVEALTLPLWPWHIGGNKLA